MVRKLHLLLTLLLLVTVNVVWAQQSKMTFVQSSTTEGELTGAPEGVTAMFENTYASNKQQLTKGNSMTLTISGLTADYTVEGITVDIRTNKSTGVGSLTATMGGTEFGSLSISPMGTTFTPTAVNVTPTVANGDLVIKLSASVNSVYCDKFIISLSKSDANKKNSSVTFVNANYEFKEGSEELKAFGGQKATTEPADAVLTYTSDKEWALVDNDGTVVLDEKAAGVAKITATFDGNDEYNPSTASYTITVKHVYNGDGTAEKPYNVADVYYMFKNNDVATGEVHVKGIVSKVEKFNSQYGSINYYLSDDGTDTNHFECYSGLGINGTKFTSEDDITLGDIVVAKGILKEYNSTYEFDYNNEIVSWKKGVKLNISDALYSTMYYSDRTVKVPEGVEAYTYTIEKNGENDVLKNNLTYKAGDVLPAGSAVVLYAATAGNYIFKATEEEGLLDDTNVLKGSDEATTTAGGTTYYRLTKQDGKVGFAWGAENGAAFQNAAHKAYLPYTPSVAGAKVAFFALNGETTGINTIVSASTVNENAALYNLKGQRVNAAYKGIVIQNGKKFINK